MWVPNFVWVLCIDPHAGSHDHVYCQITCASYHLQPGERLGFHSDSTGNSFLLYPYAILKYFLSSQKSVYTCLVDVRNVCKVVGYLIGSQMLDLLVLTTSLTCCSYRSVAPSNVICYPVLKSNDGFITLGDCILTE